LREDLVRKRGYALVGLAVLGFVLPSIRDAIPFRLPFSDRDAVGMATICIFAGMVAVMFGPRTR
jgi:uncharacterized membrane protein